MATMAYRLNSEVAIRCLSGAVNPVDEDHGMLIAKAVEKHENDLQHTMGQ